MTDFTAAINEAAAQTDMTKTQAGGGGGGYEPPAAGPCRLRMIGYIEKGKHHDERWDKTKDEVTLRFEVSGPKHPPREFNGVQEPTVINVNLNKSLHEKAAFAKLFKRMNYDGSKTHMAQLLGKPFLGTITHNVVGEKTYANLRDDGGFTIKPPFAEDFETGESRPVEVAPAISPLQCFLWGNPTQEMWDSIFIDGRWPDKTDDAGNVIKEGSSKNFHQERIKAAQNFPGSVIDNLLNAGGAVPVKEDTPPARASGDPLEGV